jgi:hypothetical protein
LDPPIPKPEEKFIILLPDDRPVRFPNGQLSIFDMMFIERKFISNSMREESEDE